MKQHKISIDRRILDDPEVRRELVKAGFDLGQPIVQHFSFLTHEIIFEQADIGENQ